MKLFNHTNQHHSASHKPVGLWGAFKVRLMSRLHDHVAHCAKCQQRLALVNRVESAFLLMKSQPYKIGLLSQANTQVLKTLSRPLRQHSSADSLRNAKSEATHIEKMRPVFERVLNTAACVFVVCMIKVGISHSLLDCQDQGQTAIENYYARNLDTQTFDELFQSDSSSTT